MSHVSTSRDSYLRNLCRKIETCEVTDGQNLVRSIARQGKVLNRKLHVLDSEEQRTLHDLEDEIEHIKECHTHEPISAVDVQVPSVSESFLNHAANAGKQRASDGRKGQGQASQTCLSEKKAKAHRAATECASSPLPIQKRTFNLRRYTPLSSSNPDLRNLRDLTGFVTKMSPLAKRANAGQKTNHSQNLRHSGTDFDLTHLPRLSSPAAKSSATSERQPKKLDMRPTALLTRTTSPMSRSEMLRGLHNQRQRSASLNDLQGDTRNSPQRSRASSFRTQNENRVQPRAARRSHEPHHTLCPSPLAERHAKRNLNSSLTRAGGRATTLCPTHFVTGKDSAKPAEQDPNSVECLMNCRYLRVPQAAAPSNDDVFDFP